MTEVQQQHQEDGPEGKPKKAPKGQRISKDGCWETNSNWPKGLLRYIPSGTFYARIRKRPHAPKRKSLETTDWDEACRRLPNVLASLRSELEEAGKTKEDEAPTPITWTEAHTRHHERFKGQAIRLEKRHISVEQYDLTIRRINFFWPSLGPTELRTVTAFEAEKFFTEAYSGTGRFTVDPRRPWKPEKNNFKAGKQSKACYNKMLTYLQVTTYRAIEMDVERGLPAFKNPFRGIKKLKTDDPPPDLPSTEEFAQILTEVRYPSDERVEEDFLNYACIRHMAMTGMRIGEEMGQMANHHPEDIPNPGFRFKDILDEGVNPGTFVHSEKKRPSQEVKTRLVPFIEGMDDFVQEIRAKLFNGNPEALVFEGVDLIRGVNNVLARACKKLGLAVITQQDLRHYFVTTCVEQNIDFKTIAEWIGHDDGGSLLATRYSHLRPRHSQEMAARVSIPTANPRCPKAIDSPLGAAGVPGAAPADSLKDSTKVTTSSDNQSSEAPSSTQSSHAACPPSTATELVTVGDEKYSIEQLKMLAQLGLMTLKAAGQKLAT